MVVMNENKKLVLCFIELFICFMLILSVPMLLMGIYYPFGFHPLIGIIHLFGSSLLGTDLVLRAATGKGLSW